MKKHVYSRITKLCEKQEWVKARSLIRKELKKEQYIIIKHIEVTVQ